MSRPAIDLFHKTFGTIPRSVASAPGRVNLIGEHTDYNGGPVLPIAIAQRTSAAVGPGPNGDAAVLEAISTRDEQLVRVSWQEQLPTGWAAYVAGVLRELWALEVLPPSPDGPVRVAVASDVPVGAGLASSAALSVAVATALAPSLTPRQIAGVAFRAEHDHVGVRCGVMDQTISALGKKDHALLFECASLEAKQIPFNARLLLVDTGVRHNLSAGGLNQRRAECEEAVKRLKVELPELVWLASWPTQWLARLKRALREPLRSRAVHVVSETARARFGAQLLEQGRLKRFGQLLYESHESCRRLYECSSAELDTIVSAAKRAGALGARLTGAGWGGAAIVLVSKRDSRTIPAIQRAYERAYGKTPPISDVKASAGAHTERL